MGYEGGKGECRFLNVQSSRRPSIRLRLEEDVKDSDLDLMSDLDSRRGSSS